MFAKLNFACLDFKYFKIQLFQIKVSSNHSWICWIKSWWVLRFWKFDVISQSHYGCDCLQLQWLCDHQKEVVAKRSTIGWQGHCNHFARKEVACAAPKTSLWPKWSPTGGWFVNNHCSSQPFFALVARKSPTFGHKVVAKWSHAIVWLRPYTKL